MDVVRLSVPGTLHYRDVVLRVVGSVCRQARHAADHSQGASHRDRDPSFDDKVISAVGEAFNNVVIHAYATERGDAELELAFEQGTLTVRLSDRGEGFNFSTELSTELDEGRETLRESNMGLEIMLTCMDTVSFTRGGPTAPNVLTMTKRYCAKTDPPNGRA